MDELDRAKAIINIAKGLKAFAAGERNVVRYFAATRLAGQAGLFGSGIKGFSKVEDGLTAGRVEALYNEVGFDVFTFRSTVVPWLTKHRLAYWAKNDVGEDVLVSTIVRYDALLRAVTAMYDELEPTATVARGCQELVHMVSAIPRPESETRQELSARFGEEKAALVVDLAKGLKLVAFNKPPGAKEAVLYSETVWERLDARAAVALPRLSRPDRAALEVLIEKIREYQGLPEDVLRTWAQQNNAERMLDFAISVNLFTRTGIAGEGTIRNFLTTPHFYAEVREEFGDDVCDRVKLFLDSIRQGQHYSHRMRGQIWDPSALLRKLYNTGSVGPATAIGEDYTMVERAGIICVERSVRHRSRYYLRSVQSDVIKKTLEVVERKVLSPDKTLLPADFNDKGQFLSAPEGRVRAALAALPGEMQEAERDFLTALRED